jgi:hypothetical protein
MSSPSFTKSTALPTLPENHPLTIGRLQQSARDILRNLESAMASKTSSSSNASVDLTTTAATATATTTPTLEQAFRSMFTSCTFGATMASNDEDDDDDGDGETDSRSTAMNHGVVGVSTSSTDSSSFMEEPAKRKVKRTKSSAVDSKQTKTMISSTKESLRRLASMHTAVIDKPLRTKVQPLPPPQKVERTSSSKVAVDHIYEHLFFAEEQARRVAANATTQGATVSNPDTITTRSSHFHASEQRPNVLSPIPPCSEMLMKTQESSPNGRVGIVPLRRISQPFPISKPATSTPPVAQPAVPSLPIHSVSTPNMATRVSRNLTFDDDISAISAHTLEAMMTTGQQKQRATLEVGHDDSFLSQPPSLSKQQPTSTFTPRCSDPNVVTPNKITMDGQQTSEADFCRAATIPHANQMIPEYNNFNSQRHRTVSSSSSSAQLLKRRSSSSHSGLLRGVTTPNSSRSITSHSSSRGRPKTHSGHTSFSPSTSGSGNQSFDHWRTVEQEFWDSVVANDDDNNNGNNKEHDATTEPVKLMNRGKSSSSTSYRQPHQRVNSMDGWSAGRSIHSRGSRDNATADSTIFSSSLTAISHGGSSHGPMLQPQKRSQSWLALHPHHHHPHDTFPIIFASTAIPIDDGSFIDHPHHIASYHYDDMNSGEI